jgi:hypothetical protein
MPGSLSLGMNLKYMKRRKDFKTAYLRRHATSGQPTTNTNTDSFLGQSFGIDLGAIYHLNSVLNFGLNVTDIYNSEIAYEPVDDELDEDCKEHLHTSGYTAKINPKLNIGISCYPLKTNDSLVFAFDLTDLTNSDESYFKTSLKKELDIDTEHKYNPLKKFHIGAEYKYNPFVIRAGFNSGYPTIGGGIIVNAAQLEYAFYGEEREMRDECEWFHRVLFSIKLGGKSSRKSKKQMS